MNSQICPCRQSYAKQCERGDKGPARAGSPSRWRRRFQAPYSVQTARDLFSIYPAWGGPRAPAGTASGLHLDIRQKGRLKERERERERQNPRSHVGWYTTAARRLQKKRGRREKKNCRA